MFVIFPGIGLAVFVIFYISFSNQEAAAALRHQQEVARQNAIAEHKKEEAEAKARADALQREKEQKEQEAAAEAAREKKFEDELHKVQSDIATYSAEADAYARKASELQIELDALHREKDKASRRDFELLKEVEQAQVQQTDAQLQIQRMVDMIARRADQSTLMQGQATPPSS